MKVIIAISVLTSFIAFFDAIYWTNSFVLQICAWLQDESHKTVATGILAVTVVVAASTFMSAQMAQALTIEEGIQLLNQGAGRLEQAQQPEAAAQLRALAANLTDVEVCEICPQCG